MARTTVYNEKLTADWDKVSKKNKTLVKEYIQYCQSNDKSPQTIKQYTEWLKVFFCWNYKENEDKFFILLKKRDFIHYFGYLRELGMSPNRIAALKSCLSSLSTEIELLYEDEYPQFHNQLRGLEPVHITTVRDKTVLTNEQIKDMLNRLTDEGEYQLACWVSLVCSSGARKAELLQMKVNFFTEQTEVFDGYMYCTPAIRSKGRGKRGKIIKKYVIKEAFKPYLDNWLTEREKLGINIPELFVRKEGDQWLPATVASANNFANKISRRFKIDFYSHSGRHYFCTLLKSMKLPDDVVTLIFSWESSDMIKIYNDVSDDEILKDFFKNHNKEAQGDLPWRI